MTQRQVAASKELTNPPVSQFSTERFVMNEGVPAPMKASLDFAKTPLNRSMGTNEMSDFLRYSRRDVSNRAPVSKKVHI